MLMSALFVHSLSLEALWLGMQPHGFYIHSYVPCPTASYPACPALITGSGSIRSAHWLEPGHASSSWQTKHTRTVCVCVCTRTVKRQPGLYVVALESTPCLVASSWPETQQTPVRSSDHLPVYSVVCLFISFRRCVFMLWNAHIAVISCLVLFLTSDLVNLLWLTRLVQLNPSWTNVRESRHTEFILVLKEVLWSSLVNNQQYCVCIYIYVYIHTLGVYIYRYIYIWL